MLAFASADEKHEHDQSERKVVTVYTQAVDGMGDYLAGRKAMTLLSTNQNLSLVWIVETQQRSIQKDIEALQKNEAFRVKIISIAPPRG